MRQRRGGKWMIVAEVEAIDARPVARDRQRIDRNRFIGYSKDEARPQRRQPPGARVAFMLGITRDDSFALLRAVVLRILQGHLSMAAL